MDGAWLWQVMPELGTYSLILALMASLLQGLMPCYSYWRNLLWPLGLVFTMTCAQAVFLLLAFGILIGCFLENVFSVAYVANNSNSLLPWYYKIAAVWGAHEGSMLLWSLILAGWSVAVVITSRSLPFLFKINIVAVMGWIQSGFLLFLLFTSNPFARLLPLAPLEGQDLNPLLQDFGLIIHPPLLYMGYVGFAVAFAFAIASLIEGRLELQWSLWVRPWCAIAWAFLTLGIMLGSWWAYYELGWGGWWFWDPVENASLMPWLTATALLHGLIINNQGGDFRSWTLLLALVTFALSLLGTFLVRSGVLTSIHAFANDPMRGNFILFLLALAIIGSMILFIFRAPKMRTNNPFALLARETWLLLGNVVLLVMMFTVLLGTLYPLVLSALHWGQISVGPPYFNLLFVPLTALLALTMNFALNSRWRTISFAQFAWRVGKSLILALFIIVILRLIYAGSWTFGVSVGLLFALAIGLPACHGLWPALQLRSWQALRQLPRRYFAMFFGHLGLAITIIGITLVSHFEIEQNVSLHEGQMVAVGDYQFRLLNLLPYQGVNYQGERATVAVSQQDKLIALMHPEKRFYDHDQVTTEIALSKNLWRDLYVALGERLGQHNWSVRIQIKPFIRWIWAGALLMVLAAYLVATDRRKGQLSVPQSIKRNNA